jgi:hypothetical protein
VIENLGFNRKDNVIENLGFDRKDNVIENLGFDRKDRKGRKKLTKRILL